MNYNYSYSWLCFLNKKFKEKVRYDGTGYEIYYKGGFYWVAVDIKDCYVLDIDFMSEKCNHKKSDELRKLVTNYLKEYNKLLDIFN